MISVIWDTLDYLQKAAQVYCVQYYDESSVISFRIWHVLQ